MYVERQSLIAGDKLALNSEYKIIEEIGKGTSSIVYLAEDCSNSRLVLIKELYPKNLGIFRNTDNSLVIPASSNDNFEIYKSYLREAVKLQIEFHNSDELANSTSDAERIIEYNNTLYVVMGRVVGKSYDKVKPKNLDSALKICKSLTKAISFYHLKGYLHLDIKAENVFKIQETDELVKLFDFDSVHKKEDIINENCKPTYSESCAAPEVKKIEHGKYDEIDERSDIYSIGAMLFRKVMGRDVETEDSRPKKRWDFTNIELLKTESPQAKSALTEIFRNTLARNKKDRYKSTDELIEALDKAIEITSNKIFLCDHNITTTTSKDYYISRADKVREIREKLDNYHIAYLYGIGGIGKSETAREYAETYRNDYEVIHFTHYSIGLKETLSSLNFINLDDKDFKLEERYNVRLNMLSKKGMYNSNTLLIIDNYNVAPDSDEYKNNIEVMKDLKKLDIHILFTTRTSTDDNNRKIDIEELSGDNLKQLFFAVNPKDSNSEERIKQVDELIETAFRHTLTVDLVAHQTVQIERYGKETLADYITVLKNSGLNNEVKLSVYNNKDDNEKNDIVYEHIKALFNFSSLTDKERYVMVNACLLPVSGMETAEFCEFIDLANYSGGVSVSDLGEDNTITNLVKGGWIKKIDGETSKITLHPIVACVISQLFHPNLNEKSCMRFVLKLSKEIRNNKNCCLIANTMIHTMYQSNKRDINYCIKKVWDIPNITCFNCSLDEIYFQRLVVSFINLGRNMKEMGYYNSAHLYVSQASYMCYKWKSLCNNFLLSKIYLLLGDLDTLESHKAYKKCCELLNSIERNKFYRSYALFNLAKQELYGRNMSNAFDKYLVCESYNHILECRGILLQILCTGYINHNIIEITRILYAKSEQILVKYEKIQGDISHVEFGKYLLELPEEGIESFLDRIDGYTEILLTENISNSELKNLVAYMNKLIYSITINYDFHISTNNMNELIKYLKVVSKTSENESILPICENLISKVKDESILCKYDDKVLFDLYWTVFYIYYDNSRFYEAERWGLLCLEQKYFKFYSLVQLEDTETAQIMYKEIIPNTYYYLSVVEGNLDNEKKQKEYYQKAVLYLVLLLDNYSIDMHKNFYCIINENQIEKLFMLVDDLANKANNNGRIIKENKIIDDLEFFEKEVNSVLTLGNIAEIGNYSFAKCKTLKIIAFLDKLTHIGNCAFENCIELREVLLPNTLLRIGSGTFRGCRKLTNVYLPDSVISIGSSAFEKCDKLKSISLSPKMTEIETSLFEDCFSLTSVVIPEKCVKIGIMSFHNCYNLRKINLSKVVIIEDCAFMGCNNLEKIFIPQSVKMIGDLAFLGCNAELQCIKNSYADTRLLNLGIPHKTLYSDEAADFIVNDSVLLNYIGDNEIVVIPDLITEIAPYAFCNNKTIKEVVCNNNIEKIGEFAFYSSSLQKIKLPADILIIGESAFEKTLHLKNIIIPASIKKLSKKTFAESGLKYVILNEGLEEIEEECFYNCKNLNKMNLPKSLYSIKAKVFANDTELNIKIPKNVIFIGNQAFKNCQIDCEEDSYAKVYFDYLQSLI